MVSLTRIVKQHEEGISSHEIAAKHDVPVAEVWRQLARHYERLYRLGGKADERIASAEQRVIRAEIAAQQAQDALAIDRDTERYLMQQSERAKWQARVREIAREDSPARRHQLAVADIDSVVPPLNVIDLRSKGAS